MIIIYGPLLYAKVPARLEPPGLVKSDGKDLMGDVELWKDAGVGCHMS